MSLVLVHVRRCPVERRTLKQMVQWIHQNPLAQPRGVAPPPRESARSFEDEAARLEALRICRLLDTPMASRFDVFTRSASRILNRPISAVCLLDERRRWFMSTVGFDFVASPREGSFCDEVISHPGQPLVVEDATVDPRFIDAFGLGTDHIRFYAGVALHDLEGHPVGAFFIADLEPGHIDAQELALLVDLGEGVDAVLALHESVVALSTAVACDDLTGLLRRQPFERRVDEAIRAAQPGGSCSVLCLDIDRFKQINDEHGHAVGDLVLVETSSRLTKAIRSTDVVARLSGDEFAVLLTGPVQLQQGRMLAERILDAFERPFEVDGEAIHICISVGGAYAPDDAHDTLSLLHCADLALYAAKRAGGGRYQMFEPTRERLLVGRRRMMIDLEAAVGSAEFRLDWQPMVEAQTGVLGGYEVLLRWSRLKYGEMVPVEFIAAAEERGLIGQIDRWVLAEACRRAVSLPEPLTVSVNISASWFAGSGIVEVVRDALADSGLAPSRLMIEITERALIEDRPEALQQMQALKLLGVDLALDDFGTGYSSLGTLSRYPFDVIKLDRSFVKDLCINPRSREVAVAVFNLGHRLGMRVCAEGVERAEQRMILREEGCDMLQGYLIGRPMALGAFPGALLVGTAREIARLAL